MEIEEILNSNMKKIGILLSGVIILFILLALILTSSFKVTGQSILEETTSNLEYIPRENIIYDYGNPLSAGLEDSENAYIIKLNEKPLININTELEKKNSSNQ